MIQENKREEWSSFLKLCSKIKTSQELDSFFSLFLTFEEREIIMSRFLIIKELLGEQLTQRKISEIHKVSIAQITRGSNALKVIDPKFKEFLKKLILERI